MSSEKAEAYDVFPDPLKYVAVLFKKKPANDNEIGDLEKLADAEEESGKTHTNVVYLEDYEKERQSAVYDSTISAYLNRRQDALQDFTDRVPGKHVDILPPSVMGGILGFTYLGQDRMALRDDLIGLKKMVDIHESIHTPDEYETRVLTDWIMSKEKVRYIK